jgi:hypothetical protein
MQRIWTDELFAEANATWLKQKSLPVLCWINIYYYIKKWSDASVNQRAMLQTVHDLIDETMLEVDDPEQMDCYKYGLKMHLSMNSTCSDRCTIRRPCEQEDRFVQDFLNNSRTWTDELVVEADVTWLQQSRVGFETWAKIYHYIQLRSTASYNRSTVLLSLREVMCKAMAEMSTTLEKEEATKLLTELQIYNV